MSIPANENIPPDRDEEASAWCIRVAEGPLDPGERRAFDAWLAESGNASAYDAATELWHTTGAYADRPEFIRRRTQALEHYRQANSRRWRRGSDRWRLPADIAAALLLMVLSAYLLLRNPAQIYETRIGERRVALLDDGSRVSLDAATLLEVRLRDDRREIRLVRGRAKFDVAKDALRPFSVSAGNKVVVATGTSFSVELLRTQIRVLLYEGHVEVLQRGQGSARPRQLTLATSKAPADRLLLPGDELIAPIELASAKVVKTDTARSLSWEAGQLSFDAEPLQSAIDRVNRYSNEAIEVGDAPTASIRITGTFDAGNTDAFVEGITALHPVRAIRGDGRIVLTRN